MEDEVEDIVGDVKYTDSQKSVAASNAYSLDFTDSSSEKNNSDKDTYVIEPFDSEDSDTSPIHEDNSVIFIKNPKPKRNAIVQCENNITVSRAASTNLHNCSILAQEIFTQTSKTILELAQSEGADKENLETQTSFISITENKTVQYRIEFKNSIRNFENDIKTSEENNSNYVLSNALDDESSKFPVSDSETIKSDDISEVSSEDRIINIINDESKDNLLSEENHETQYENTSDFEESNDSDIEEDSLMVPHRRKEVDNSDTSETPQSVDDEVEQLYNKLSESIDLQIDRTYGPDRLLSTLTPLTEESTIKKDSLQEITPTDNINGSIESDNDVLFTNNAGVKVKMFSDNQDTFKLPPIQIQNRSCPNSPHLNFLFSVQGHNRLNKSGTLPCLYEDTGISDRWEIEHKELASGESPLISGRYDPSRGKDGIHLPPIHIEGYVVNSKVISKNDNQFSNVVKIVPSESRPNAISINEKIRELKYGNKSGKTARSKYRTSASERSRSPSSESPGDTRLCDAAEKGSEALCVELIRRLQSSSWCEVADTLEDIPKVLERFWGVITEHRIADLIRQISAHVDSPRTNVARSACNTLASVVKNTNYTKKPDFYEAVTLLLMKTGSFCHPVRRAANVALDDIVCGVELSHAVTALCVHGIDHKSALVRCASCRLLVVCSALAGGGRGVLRSRPPSAASARCHALRALSTLLDDKNTDTRKYAERLYAMLRPLPNFEAYYLTDVDVETASRQMKKHDKMLLCGSSFQ